MTDYQWNLVNCITLYWRVQHSITIIINWRKVLFSLLHIMWIYMWNNHQQKSVPFRHYRTDIIDNFIIKINVYKSLTKRDDSLLIIWNKTFSHSVEFLISPYTAWIWKQIKHMKIMWKVSTELFYSKKADSTL